MLVDLEKFRQTFIQKLEARSLTFDENELMLLNIDADLQWRFFEVLK